MLKALNLDRPIQKGKVSVARFKRIVSSVVLDEIYGEQLICIKNGEFHLNARDTNSEVVKLVSAEADHESGTRCICVVCDDDEIVRAVINKQKELIENESYNRILIGIGLYDLKNRVGWVPYSLVKFRYAEKK